MSKPVLYQTFLSLTVKSPNSSIAITMMAIGSIATISNCTISSNMSMSVINSSDHANIVRVSSGVGIMYRKSMMDLAKSVSIRLSFSITLSIVAMVGISMVTISIVSSVANGTIASNISMTIVNTSNNTYIMGMSSSISVMDWETMINLTKGVSIRL